LDGTDYLFCHACFTAIKQRNPPKYSALTSSSLWFDILFASNNSRWPLFLFGGEDIDGRPETNLAAFPASELFDGTTIAVETKYAIPGRGNSPGRSGYTYGTF
jgi:hypothetical protein